MMNNFIKITVRSMLIWSVLMVLSVIGFWVTNLEVPTFYLSEWDPGTRMIIYLSLLVSFLFGWVSHVISD